MSPGATKTVTCNDYNGFGLSKVHPEIAIDWTDLSNNANYVQASDDLALVGSVSSKYLATIQANEYWGTQIPNGCYNESADPINLCTCADLNFTNENGVWANDFELQNNIDFNRCKEIWSEEDYTTGEGFLPIGYSGSCDFGGCGNFETKFEGNSFVIKNLLIDRSESNGIGLLTIKNGGSVDAEVNNLGIYGTVTGGNYVGGIIGGVYMSAAITNSYFSGSVAGSDGVGGLVGSYNDFSSISNSYFSGGDVIGTNYVGGLVGASYYFSSNVIGSYFSGNTISGSSNFGGITGTNMATNFGSGYPYITNSFWLEGSAASCADTSTNIIITNCGTCTSQSDCASKAGLN